MNKSEIVKLPSVVRSDEDPTSYFFMYANLDFNYYMVDLTSIPKKVLVKFNNKPNLFVRLWRSIKKLFSR